MHHCLIDLDAESAGKTMIPQTRGFTPVIEDKLTCYGIEAECGNTGCNPFGHLTQRAAYEIAGRSHHFNFFRCLDINHYLE